LALGVGLGVGLGLGLTWLGLSFLGLTWQEALTLLFVAKVADLNGGSQECQPSDTVSLSILQLSLDRDKVLAK
jgi:hypothetical protein